jgi:hypothetical protein
LGAVDPGGILRERLSSIQHLASPSITADAVMMWDGYCPSKRDVLLSFRREEQTELGRDTREYMGRTTWLYRMKNKFLP